MEDIFKTCTECKELKSLNCFNKGNAKYQKKSWCKICQSRRNGIYKKQPEVRERENELARKRNAECPQYLKTIRYLRRKDYYDNWKIERSDVYRQGEKAKSNRRRKILNTGPKLTSRMISSLESYNISYFNSDNFTCEYCKVQILGSYHLDHIIPVCKGGTNILTNLAISCMECNGLRGKGKKLLIEWKPELQDYIDHRNSSLGL